MRLSDFDEEDQALLRAARKAGLDSAIVSHLRAVVFAVGLAGALPDNDWKIVNLFDIEGLD